MDDKFLECPKDPAMQYFKNVCETIFRKNGLRIWCQKCHYFESSTQKEEITTK
jgi:hypothetical protein